MAIEQIGNTLVGVAQYIASNVGETGLTVLCDVTEITLAATPVVTEITTGGSCTEVGRGYYLHTLAAASVDIKAIYLFNFRASGATDQQDIGMAWTAGPDWVEHVDADISALPTAAAIATAVWNVLTSAITLTGSIGKLIRDKLALLGSGQVTLTAPVADNSTVTIVRGDDYTDAHGRALEWTASGGFTPDPTTADSIVLTVKKGSTVLITASVDAPDDSTLKCELADTDTEINPSSGYDYDIEATFPAAGSEIVTYVLKQKGFVVLKDVKRP